MDDIEDYDEHITIYIKKIEKGFKLSLKDSDNSKNTNQGDKENMLKQIEKNISKLKE